jgi:hypothetical protein
MKSSCEHSNKASGSINAGKFLCSGTTGGLPRMGQLY